MKHFLLSATLLTGFASFGQFTQANEPAIGNATTMYVLDSNATNYSATTGTSVTWNYSMTPGYAGSTKSVGCVSPASTTNGANFTTSTKAIDIPGFVTTYFSSTATERKSQGFVFDGGDLAGMVEVLLDTDDELLMNYPFAVTNSLTDNLAGTATTGLGAFPCTGNVTASCDGSGTLILNGTTTLTGVLRYKLMDHVTATVPLIGQVDMDRVQYEYYHTATSNLPVFVHVALTISIGGSPTTQNLVLSSVAPDEYLAVNENETATFQMYPNPANESVTLAGLNGDETIQIVDMAGRVVLTTQASSATATIALDELQAGIYSVIINNSSKLLTVK